MRLPLESVPNFSEGRDPEVVGAIERALSEHARVLDVHSDEDHHRSVFTLVAEEEPLADALVGAVACARDRIDLRRHEGAHPRIGAADVVPVVPLRPEDMDRGRYDAGPISVVSQQSGKICKHGFDQPLMQGVLTPERLLIVRQEITCLDCGLGPRSCGHREQLGFQFALPLAQHLTVGFDLEQQSANLGGLLSRHAAMLVEVDGVVSHGQLSCGCAAGPSDRDDETR